MDARKKVSLHPISSPDVRRIRKWPPYPKEFAPLDYALRAGGWLDMFPAGKTTRRMGAWLNDELIGFTLLVDVTATEAEYYVAVHPEKTGRKLGELITRAVLRMAFEDMHLKRLYLKVRDWHMGARRLYERAGFVAIGQKKELVQGEMVDFCLMEARNQTSLTDSP